MAAGPWYVDSGYGDVLSATATRSLERALITNVKNKTFIGHPVMRYVLSQDTGLRGMLGALAMRIGLITIGDKTMAATGVGSKAGATNVAAAVVDLTPARRQLVIPVSDDGAEDVGDIGLDAAVVLMRYLVEEGTASWANTYTALMLALIPSLSITAGTTALALTWAATFNACIDWRNRGNTGRGLMILDAKGIKDLAADMSSLGGAVAWSKTAQKFLDSGYEEGVVMENFAAGVDIIMLSAMPTAGGDTYGAIVGQQAWRSKHKAVPFQPGTQAVYNVGLHRCEALRGNGTDVNDYSFTTYNTAAELDNNGGTRLIYAT